MKLLRATVILSAVAALVFVGGTTAAAAPSAPAPVAPADGASVLLPFTLSWSAVSDPSGILAYNWQVSATSTFAKVLRQDSVMAPTTRSTVSGLATGRYFWRVQAVSNDFVQGAWSAPRSVSVAGAGTGLPVTPTLNLPRGGISFHPWESFGMSWSAVPGAVKYVLEASKDSTFPVNGVVFSWESPTPSTDILITTVDRGSYRARVFAVDANGNYSMPSNVISFTIAFNAPIAAPPTLAAPTGGVSAPLPVTFRWNHVVNPQSSGYHLQISRNVAFTQIEQDIPFLNGPTYTVLQLPTAGTKFWRVRSFQGVINTAGTAAATAFSQVGSFVVPDGPLRVSSLAFSLPNPASGQEVYVDLQLSKGAPPGGATINLSSSNPQAAPLPASVAVAAGVSFAQFRFVTGQVATPTTVTMTATIGSQSTSQTFTVSPSSLKSLEGVALRQNGGVTGGGIVMLNGQAPAGGAVVSLSSSSPAAQPPATVTVPAGLESVFFSMPTGQVSADTPVTITATWKGVSVRATTTLTPQPQPTSITLEPATTTGSSGSTGRVTAADPRNEDITFSLSSSRPDLVSVPGSVIVPQFGAAGGFIISTVPVSTRTLVDISVMGGGVTLTATLTLDPVATAPPPPALSTFVLNPTNLTGGANSAGTVVLTRAAPVGGTVVNLSSSAAVATVPASVTVPAGATSAPFTVSTTSVSTAQSPSITASAGGVTQVITMTLNPAPAPPSPTLSALSVSPATVTGGASTTGTVTLSATAPAGGVIVSLSSADTAVATVPASVTVPAGAASTSFSVATAAVSASRSLVLSGTAGGITRTATLTVNPANTPPATDTVTIGRLEFGAGRLRVEATSSAASATLTAYVTLTGDLIGTLSGGRLDIALPANPQNVTVKSSLGGSAARAVTVK